MDFASGLGDGAWLLYGIVRAAKPQTVVEIGSAQGKSTCYIAAALSENTRGHLYAIDPHSLTSWNDVGSVETYTIIQRNLKQAGVAEKVTLLRETSENVAATWDRPIDVLFIDGDHSYDGVKRDWERFVPHVSSFGFVVFHDTLWDLHPDPKYQRADMGVPRFVEELRRSGYPVVTINQHYGVSIVQPRRGGVPLSTASEALVDGEATARESERDVPYAPQ
jgi:predicted O-methyltransferase YrrM